jgi:hypothetical protein
MAWPKVCWPAELGGLGIPNMQIQGFALPVHWLWLQRIDPNRPSSQLPDHTEKMVAALFNASLSVQIGNGNRTFSRPIAGYRQGHCIADGFLLLSP